MDGKVPPNIHLINMVEKAISMFMDHFQAIIAGVNSTFPIHCLLPQAESTLNMLQPMNIVPTRTCMGNMILAKCH